MYVCIIICLKNIAIYFTISDRYIDMYIYIYIYRSVCLQYILVNILYKHILRIHEYLNEEYIASNSYLSIYYLWERYESNYYPSSYG